MRYTAFDTFVCRVQGWFSLRVSEEWDWIKQFEKAETDEMKNRWRIRIGVSEDEDYLSRRIMTGEDMGVLH